MTIYCNISFREASKGSVKKGKVVLLPKTKIGYTNSNTYVINIILDDIMSMGSIAQW